MKTGQAMLRTISNEMKVKCQSTSNRIVEIEHDFAAKKVNVGDLFCKGSNRRWSWSWADSNRLSWPLFSYCVLATHPYVIPLPPIELLLPVPELKTAPPTTFLLSPRSRVLALCLVLLLCCCYLGLYPGAKWGPNRTN